MKKVLFLLSLLLATHFASAQLKLKKSEEVGTEKKKKFNLMEKIGDVTGNLMTGKTEVLEGVVVKAGYITSLYSKEVKSTEAKYFPEGAQGGDQMVGITFFKNEGVGMLELIGEVTANGEQMEYYGLGSYGAHYFVPRTSPVVIKVKTVQGDEASFTMKPIPDVEIISVNGETALPILDLDEDIELEYVNPPGSEGTTIKVSMLTKVMGVTALNHFADFKVTKSGTVKVTIPKEALASPEISGELNAGNFDKGDNFIIVERELKTDKSEYGADQNPGKLAASELFTKSYATFPVILKGKQDGGLLTNIIVRGKSADKTIGYDFSKPNANYGIPLSKASKFGLVSFTMEAKTFKKDTDVSTDSWSSGGTKYTRTTTTTTTYDFPELSDSHWETAMDQIYKEVVSFFKSEYNIEFAPVEDVTSTPQYSELFTAQQVNNEKRVIRSYKDTKRSAPSSIGEILGSMSTNLTTDNPTVNMMKAAGDLDGLVSMHVSLQVGGNGDGNVVLFPSLSISIQGLDETRDDKQGTYITGRVSRTTGEPFNESKLKSDPNELARVCSMPILLDVTKGAITTMRAKEIELGYDKIWNIYEE